MKISKFHNFIIRDNADGLTEDNLVRLWHSVDWVGGSAKAPDRLLAALKNADSIFTAWDGEKLIGLCSALDDGLNAWISYMVVDSGYQNSGIGGFLVDQMIHTYSGFRIHVQTMHAVKFYAKHGFTEIMTSLKIDDM